MMERAEPYFHLLLLAFRSGDDWLHHGVRCAVVFVARTASNSVPEPINGCSDFH